MAALAASGQPGLIGSSHADRESGVVDEYRSRRILASRASSSVSTRAGGRAARRFAASIFHPLTATRIFSGAAPTNATRQRCATRLSCSNPPSSWMWCFRSGACAPRYAAGLSRVQQSGGCEPSLHDRFRDPRPDGGTLTALTRGRASDRLLAAVTCACLAPAAWRPASRPV